MDEYITLEDAMESIDEYLKEACAGNSNKCTAEEAGDAGNTNSAEPQVKYLGKIYTGKKGLETVMQMLLKGGHRCNARVVANEAVDDLRLRVYEAFEEGVIDEDEKTSMLEYLNIENYE